MYFHRGRVLPTTQDVNIKRCGRTAAVFYVSGVSGNIDALTAFDTVEASYASIPHEVERITQGLIGCENMRNGCYRFFFPNSEAHQFGRDFINQNYEVKVVKFGNEGFDDFFAAIVFQHALFEKALLCG